MMEIYSHRGLPFGPENTYASIQKAMEMGFCIETDLWPAKDCVIAHHDAVTGRVLIPKGKRISQLTKKEFSQMSVSGIPVRVPLFLETIGALMDEHPRIKALWEVKQTDRLMLAAIIKIIAKKKLWQRVTIIGFSGMVSSLTLLAREGIQVGIIDTLPLRMRKRAQDIGVSAILTGWTSGREKRIFLAAWPLLRLKYQIRQLHGEGKKLIMGVIDEPEWAKYFADLGCDGLVTNNPELIKQALL